VGEGFRGDRGNGSGVHASTQVGSDFNVADQLPCNGLPKEAKPEHIIYRGDLKVGYDTQQGSYYVHGVFKVQPKEYKEIEIELKDIWVIDTTEIETVRFEARKVNSMLTESEFSERAQFLLTSIEGRLDKILESQKDKPVNPEDHISQYRENVKSFEEAKSDLALARSLMSQVKPITIRATWQLILMIVIFLGLLSAGFYVAWQRQVKLSEPPTIEDEK